MPRLNRPALFDDEDITLEALDSAKPFDSIDFIMRYEEGEVDAEEMYAGFQQLVESGLIYQLQGHYGRTARSLGLL
jgi:hypothetical protein